MTSQFYSNTMSNHNEYIAAREKGCGHAVSISYVCVYFSFLCVVTLLCSVQRVSTFSVHVLFLDMLSYVFSNCWVVLIGLWFIYLQCSISLNMAYVLSKCSWNPLSTFSFYTIKSSPQYILIHVSCSVQYVCCWQILNIWVAGYPTLLFYISQLSTTTWYLSNSAIAAGHG